MIPHTTRSGIQLQPACADPAGQGEFPGEFPFTRGRRAHAAASGGWIQRALSGEGSATHSNAQLKYLILRGQTGIDVIGDAATAAALVPNHPLAKASVGTQGVSLCRKQDILELLSGIPLDKISFSASLSPQTTIAGYSELGPETWTGR